MKIPRVVKIGARKHTVDLVYEIGQSNGNTQRMGVINHPRAKITLATHFFGERIGKEYIEENFLHEIVHGVSETYGVGLNEKQVSAIAGGLYQVIKDSKLKF